MTTNTYATCAVCLDDIPITISFPAGPDAVCSDCAKEEIVPLFLNALKYEIHYPPTWAGDQHLHWEHYQELLPNDYGMLLEKKQFEYYTPLNERLYCQNVLYADEPLPQDHNPQDEQSQTLALTKKQIADANDNGIETRTCGAFRKKTNSTAAKCGHCAGYACRQCGAPREDAKVETPCPKCNTGSEKTDGADHFEGLKRGRDYQLCPNASCEMPVFLGDGCNHMTCPATFCKTQFCYICGERTTADGGHWNAETSRCPRFNQPDAANATYDHPGPTAEEVDRAVAAHRSIFAPFDLHDLRDFEASQPTGLARFRQWDLNDEEFDARPRFLQDVLGLLRQEHQTPYAHSENGIDRLHANVHQLAMAVFTYLFRMSSPQPSDFDLAIDAVSFARLDNIRLDDLDILASRWGFLQLFDNGLSVQHPALSNAIRIAGRVWAGWGELVRAHVEQVTAARIQDRRRQWEFTPAEIAVVPTEARELMGTLRAEHQEAYAFSSVTSLDDALQYVSHRIAFEIHEVVRLLHTQPALDAARNQTLLKGSELLDQTEREQQLQNLIHSAEMWEADWEAAVARDPGLQTTYPMLNLAVPIFSSAMRDLAESVGDWALIPSVFNQ
ncbi:hypothetical protein LTR78_010552 [Recurvomyces mirabilis]|uniref:RBR-type E3 ubiquitin transferase n=1 Tax=Recurvomyces mirabilis TaxID=574656 RepID=A0AAE0TPU1_9PEZI|nr:hypothetical protein LTR78_010552 [Recurvomyces mirabilis]KAK5160804.1 hypothetical protein LTS14_001817 [Recurvomyces mirabilis]